MNADAAHDLDPHDLPARAAEIYRGKVSLGTGDLLLLGFLAGVFIAFGSVFFLVVLAVPPGAVPYGLQQFFGGLAFSVGLILVMVAGAELFTGNTLMLTLRLRGECGWSAIGRAWALAYFGNLAGSLFVVVLFAVAGGFAAGDGALGQVAAEIAAAKTAKGALALVASGVLANMLVCIAVWMTFAAKTVQGKVLVIVPPIACFVAAGFEHSVANMSLIPAGLLAAWTGNAVVEPAPGLGGFLWNLLFATTGNILGGGLIAAAYGRAYGRAQAAASAGAKRV